MTTGFPVAFALRWWGVRKVEYSYTYEKNDVSSYESESIMAHGLPRHTHIHIPHQGLVQAFGDWVPSLYAEWQRRRWAHHSSHTRSTCQMACVIVGCLILCFWIAGMLVAHGLLHVPGQCVPKVHEWVCTCISCAINMLPLGSIWPQLQLLYQTLSHSLAQILVVH